MKTIFKVGDKVWDGIHCQGEHGIVEEISDYISVKFNGKALLQYFLDGRLAMTGKVQTLSKAPYTFQLPEQPVEFEEGDPVLVRDDEYMTWKTGRFISMSGKRFFIEHGGCQMRWNCCIPFDLEKMGHV